MINDDILIKYARKRGYKKTWPDQVNRMKTRMTEMKLGFMGIGNDHMSLVEFQTIKEGDIFIYDPYVESGSGMGDEAPLMLKVLPDGMCYIEGIGVGLDSVRDPDRTRFRWRDTIPMPQLAPNFLVFKVEVRPTLNGGPGYYYFFKSYRDFRY